ncbi:hypothetical protein [Chryseobacterium pennipullorum]|uniref:Uncharacterized protein n=1 Tax=Chryseobacterium pennipullorum TaxID=2258963 RepID=A0A3D9AS08_9FLAO|nr:hypothetical protein [Chryseobacterium pennipullorum]REC44179.1 hypothetical protein DRF67_17780 [Chryseobacterium pennipullorum]
MTNAMPIENIYRALRNWKALIDAYMNGNGESKSEIMKFLNQGTHFSVDESEIREWTKHLQHTDDKDKAIHAYVGIDEDQLKFFLIDSYSDEHSEFDHISVKEFSHQSPDAEIEKTPVVTSYPPISSESAISRNFMFNMYCSDWIDAQKKGNFFQLVRIPFSDYSKLGLKEGESCVCFLGLTNTMLQNTPISDYHIEVITVKDLGIGQMSQFAEDYSTPRPPFTNYPRGYELLLKSDAYL